MAIPDGLVHPYVPRSINEPLLTESIYGENFSISKRRVARDFVWTGRIDKDRPHGPGTTWRRVTIRVPAGFVFDGASIPRWAWSIIGGPFGPYADAAAVHDWLYRYHHKMSRLAADNVFNEIMRDLKISTWRRRTMYRAVRIGGGKEWKKNRPHLKRR